MEFVLVKNYPAPTARRCGHYISSHAETLIELALDFCEQAWMVAVTVSRLIPFLPVNDYFGGSEPWNPSCRGTPFLDELVSHFRA